MLAHTRIYLNNHEMEVIIDDLVAKGFSRTKINAEIALFRVNIKRKTLSIDAALSSFEMYKIVFLLLAENHVELLAFYLPDIEQSFEVFKLFAQFISSSTSLKTLQIRFPRSLTNEEAEILYEAFTKNTSIQYIEFSEAKVPIHQYFNALRSNTTIHTLALDELSMCNESMIALNEYLSNSSYLNKLHLGRCEFNPESLDMLRDAIRNNYSIQTIVITDKNDTCIAEAILDAASQSYSLSHITMSRIPTNIDKFLANNKSLYTLRLDACDAPTIDDIGRLVDGLKQNETLNQLQITFSNLNDERIMKLSEAWTNNSKIKVRELDLYYNCFTINGMKALINAWKNVSKLSLRSIFVDQNFNLYGDSVNERFLENWLKQSPMIYNFTCTYETPDGEWNRLPTMEQIYKVNIRRKMHMAKILIIAQTLLYSNFISLINEESLIPTILYFVQDEYDLDNHMLLNQTQIDQIWKYAKKKELKITYDSRDRFIEFVLNS